MKTLFSKLALFLTIIMFGTQAFSQDSCFYQIEYWQTENSMLTYELTLFGDVDSNDVVTWDFGDGTSGTGIYTEHTFPDLGSYIITANINSEYCGIVTTTIELFIDSIYNPIECWIDFSYNLLDDYNVDFWAFGEGYFENTSWNWLIDSTIMTGQETTYQFQNEGEYWVTLTAENDICGAMTVTHPVYIFDNDSINFCDAYFWYYLDSLDMSTVYFISEGESQETNYYWDFGDGTTSTEMNPVHTYAEGGEYIVILTIERGDCVATFENWVWIGDDNNWYPDECQALFFAEYNQTGYEVNFFDFSWSGNSPIVEWVWNFGDSTFSNEPNPTHLYNEAGEYEVTLTIFTENCTSTFTEFVFVEDYSLNGDCQSFFFPEFNGTLSVQFFDLSMPEPSTWNWDFGDGTTSTLQNPIYTYNEPGTYFVTLETSAGDSCISAFAMEIYLYEDTLTKSTTYIGEILQAHALQVETLDVEDIANETSISIYPNPVTDLLNIDFGQKTEKTEIYIYNVNGQLVYNAEAENMKKASIDVSQFNHGVYMMQIIQNDNISSTKFVK